MHESEESSDLPRESLIGSATVRTSDKSSFWQEHFEHCESSGLSQAEYCRRHNLKYCLFHYWKRKLRKPSQPPGQAELASINLIKVSSSLSVGSSPSFRDAPVDFFRLWVGSICLEVGYKFDSRSLRELLHCLRMRPL